MRRPLSNLSTTVFLGAAIALWAGQVVEGTLSPELEARLQDTAPDDEIAVLVELADRVDVSAFSFPTKTARRRGIAAALRAEASTAEAPIRRFLDDRRAARVTSLWAIGGLAAIIRADAVEDLARLPGVTSVRLDGVFEQAGSAPKVAADGGWNLEMVGAPDLWARGVLGDGAVVAVVDSGVDAAHQDLATSWRGGNNGWFDPYGEHPSPHDPDGHGTQVAGLVVGGDAGGTAIGVAPGALWIGGKVFDDSGQATFSATHEIYQWFLDPDGDPATDDAPHVVNNSWGFRDLPGQCFDEFADDIAVLRAAGIAVVFSAGNSGPNAATSISPANNPGAFAVGGVDDQGDVMASSGRGPSACDGSVYPMLVAPGDGVRTADLTLGGIFPDNYTEVGGTSFAAPHVAGAMALLLSAHPQATLEQVEQALRAGAEDLGPDGPDNTSGYGGLDVVKAEAALAALVGGGPGDVVVYTDEGAFLAALAGQDTIAEGFEDDATWGGARTPTTAASVTSQGLTWTSNHVDNDVTTGLGAAYRGDWGIYSLPHGDQTVTQPNDFIMDGLSGAGSTPMTAVGGWVTGASGGQLSLILDGNDASPVDLGPVGVTHEFFGAVVEGSFTSFELRETEGTVEDPKIVFVDDITIGVAGGINRPPEGTILRPAEDVTVEVGEVVFFEGSASDPDGDPVTVLWDFGDGATSSALVPGNRTYAEPGAYVVTLTASDSLGVPDPTPGRRTVTVTSAPTAAMTGVVAGVADLAGAQGSDWHTDLYLHNASATDVVVDLHFSPSGATVGDAVTVTVAPGETRAIEDVVATLFGVEGSGAIHWRVVSGSVSELLVSANTFNRVGAVERYGQQVPGMRWTETAPVGSALWVPALAGRYRSNLGFATDADCSQVRVRGFDRFGTMQVEQTLAVQPLSWRQLNALFRSVFPDLLPDPDGTPVDHSVHRFEVVGVDGRVVPYTSIIDNATSDGSYMLGQRGRLADALSWLPGAALVLGANDSQWRSDVVAMNVGDAADTVSFAFFPAGADNSGQMDTVPLSLAAGASVFTENVLQQLFGLAQLASGSLSWEPPAVVGGAAWMRTYTEEEDPEGHLVTYGQAIPPRTLNEMIPAGGSGVIPGFSHDVATRSNLILQNTRAAADGTRLDGTVKVEVLAGDGSVLGEQTYALLPGEYRQHNRFVDDYGIAPLSAGAVRVTVLDQTVQGETGGIDAMISEVNGNVIDGTNDGRLIRAQGPGLP